MRFLVGWQGKLCQPIPFTKRHKYKAFNLWKNTQKTHATCLTHNSVRGSYTCMCKCCLWRQPAHSKNICHQTKKVFFLHQRDQHELFWVRTSKGLRVTGSTTRLIYIYAGSLVSWVGRCYTQLPRHSSLHGNRAEEGTQSFRLISRPECDPELRHIQQASLCACVCESEKRQSSDLLPERFTIQSEKDLTSSTWTGFYFWVNLFLAES